MSYFLLLLMIMGGAIAPALAQTPSMSSQSFVQQRAQQHAQIKVLREHLQAAAKSGDKQKMQELIEQLDEVLHPSLAASTSIRNQHRRPWVTTDPQAAAIHQQLQDAVKSNDKQKADQLRQQLNTLLKQHFSQRNQLFHDLRDAIKNKDDAKVQQLKAQLKAE